MRFHGWKSCFRLVRRSLPNFPFWVQPMLFRTLATQSFRELLIRFSHRFHPPLSESLYKATITTHFPACFDRPKSHTPSPRQTTRSKSRSSHISTLLRSCSSSTPLARRGLHARTGGVLRSLLRRACRLGSGRSRCMSCSRGRGSTRTRYH